MIRPVTRRWIPQLRNCVILLCAAPLIACITTSSGGFDVRGSGERAARDYLTLAMGYLDAGDLAAARYHLDNALEMDSHSAEIHHAAALIAVADNEFRLAEQGFGRALKLDPENAAVRNNFGVLLFSRERPGEAIEQFRRAANDSQYPGRAFALENLGRAALRLEQWDVARTSFEKALLLDENLPVSSLELSLLHKWAGDWDAAGRAFRSYAGIVEKQRLVHAPKALLAGIEIAWHSGNLREVEEFGLILGTLYAGTVEYRAYRELTSGN